MISFIKYLIWVIAKQYFRFFKHISFHAFETDWRAINGIHITIGKYTSIDKHTKIKSYTYIGKNCNITKAEIGHYVSIANNVSIGQGEHDLSKPSTSSIFYENPYNQLTQENCIIGPDVWIGVDAVILRGVKIGTGAVIGANSVVTKDVPDYAIVAGVPARVIKYRLDEKTQKYLSTAKWWEYSPSDAKKIFNNISK